MKKITAIMAGNIWKILVKPGDTVVEGQDVVILESMKMEILIPSEYNGTVKEVIATEGDFVNEEDVLLILE